MTGITVKREINLNSIAIIVGFTITLATVIASWTNLQRGQDDFVEFRTNQVATNATFEERFRKIADALSIQSNSASEIQFHLASLEKGAEVSEGRIGRITESYSNQFADIRGQLSAVATQLALIKQSLDRLEAFQQTLPRTGPK